MPWTGHLQATIMYLQTCLTQQELPKPVVMATGSTMVIVGKRTA